MNNWIQNIKGQLTELATEVLHDTTEEGQVSTLSELQVERKKCADMERQLLAEQAKTEALEKRVQELEDQFYSTNVESDAIKEKFMGIVRNREHQIAQLNSENQRLKHHLEEGDEFRNIDLGSTSCDKVRVHADNSENFGTQIELAKLKEKHEQEISSLIATNAANLRKIRDDYEQRISELESWGGLESSAVKDDEQEIGRKEIQLEEMSRKIHEMESSREQERNGLAEEMRKLKALNAELVRSYNEASAEVDALKEKCDSQQNSESTANELSAKIASLKANLNETEARYELCKLEQQETASCLEQLLKEFAELRSSMHAARATAEGNEQDLLAEVHSLRDLLGQAKTDRDKLVADFRESMHSIDEELTQLRECNLRLTQENTELGTSLAQFEELRNALNASNAELSAFRERFAQMQMCHSAHSEEMKEVKAPDLVAEESQTEKQSEQDDWAGQVEALREELREKEEELHRLRSEKPMITHLLHSAEEFKQRPPSDTDSAASNNDWERMGREEIEVEGVSSSSGGDAKKEAERELRESGTQCESGGGHREEEEGRDVTSELSTQLLEELQRRVDELGRELADGREAIAEIREEKWRMGQELSERLHELELQREERAELMEKMRILESEHTAIVDNLEGRLKNAIQINEQIAVSNEEMSAENERNRAEIAEFVEKCKQLEAEESELRRKLSEQDLKMAIPNEELAAENEGMRKNIDDLLNECEELRKQNTEWKRRAEEQDLSVAKNEELAMENGRLKAELDAQLTKFEGNHAKEAEMSTKMAELEQQLATLQGTGGDQNARQTEHEREMNYALRAENEEMRLLVQRKHQECEDYYIRLQEFAANAEAHALRLKSAEDTVLRRDQDIAASRERIVKLEGELDRLRDHLITVEDISAKEAIAAEERELELRAQIRQLQEKSNSDEINISHALDQYQHEVDQLRSRISSFEQERAQLQSALDEREASLREASTALSNLQIVLKGLAEDQKREKQQFEAELRSAKEELKRDSAALWELQDRMCELEDEKTGTEDQLEMLREQFGKKEALVDELENQLEEMRMGRRNSFTKQPNAANSYRIDDATLRQLFLSYFVAEKSKQSEIAVVMSRILGYSPEEQSQIQKALQSSSGSWFGFGGGNSAQATGQTSLTEQFVRFLEQESMAQANRVVALPAQRESARSDFFVGETPPTQPLHSSSYADDLKSILDQ